MLSTNRRIQLQIFRLLLLREIKWHRAKPQLMSCAARYKFVQKECSACPHSCEHKGVSRSGGSIDALRVFSGSFQWTLVAVALLIMSDGCYNFALHENYYCTM